LPGFGGFALPAKRNIPTSHRHDQEETTHSDRILVTTGFVRKDLKILMDIGTFRLEMK